MLWWVTVANWQHNNEMWKCQTIIVKYAKNSKQNKDRHHFTSYQRLEKKLFIIYL
jgi:hypothetical protein